MLSYHSHNLLKLGLIHVLGTAQNNGTRMLYLVDKELTEVLHVNLALGSVYNRYGRTGLNACLLGSLKNGSLNIRKFAYAGGLDKNSFGSVLLNNLCKRSSEVAYQ